MNKAEILRYMRTNSKTDNQQILDLVDSAVEKIQENVKPKTLYRIFNCKVDENGVEIHNMYFSSKRLADNLKNCKKVVVFGATLGVECDRLIKIASATDIALAMALQAAAASKIEEVCDSLEQSIINEYNVNLCQRYSPGYFDLDISEQKKVFTLLDLTKRIGLTLTDACEMVPTKSVTAFIGIKEQETQI